jgi:hypothetical protein
MAKRGWAKPNDATWHSAENLGWLTAASYTEMYRNVNGLNVYRGSSRIIYGADQGVWLDFLQGWQEANIEWRHNGTDYDIVRCARVPYLISPKSGKQKGSYLDHMLVGYANAQTTVAAGGTGTWDGQNTGGDQHGDSTEFGTFLLEDLWYSTASDPQWIDNWWKPYDAASARYGYERRDDYRDVIWKFRGIDHKVFGSVRIAIADTNGHLWYLLVGYEGGGGW